MGEGSYITFFSPSDVIAFLRIEPDTVLHFCIYKNEKTMLECAATNHVKDYYNEKKSWAYAGGW